MVALSSHRLATVLDALGCRARSNTAATGTANAGPAGKVQTQKKPSKANRQQEGAHRHHEPRPVSPRSEENVSALQQALDWVCSIEDTQPFLAWLQAAFDEGRSWAGDQRDTHEGRTFGFDVLTESESDAYRELSHLGLLPTDDQLAQWTKRNPPPAQEELIQAEIDKLKRLNQPLERLAASLKLSNETLREEMDHNDREVEILNAKLQDVAGTVNGNIASLHAASSKVDAALKTLTVKVDGLTEITKPEKDGPRFFDLLDKRPFWFQCEDEIHSLVREDSLLLEELLTLFEVDTLNMPEDSLYGDLGRSDMIEEVQRLSAAYCRTEKHHVEALLEESFFRAKLQYLQDTIRLGKVIGQHSSVGEYGGVQRRAEDLISSTLPPLWNGLATFQVKRRFLAADYERKLDRQQRQMAKLDEFTELLRDQFAKYKYLDRSFQLETNRFEELLGDIDEFATECLKIHRFLSHRIDLAAQPSLHNDTGRTVDMRDSSIQQLYQQLGGSDGRAGENLERSVAPSKFVLLSVDSICGAATRLAETVEISTKNAERLEGEVMSKAEETLLCVRRLENMQFKHSTTVLRTLAPHKWHDIQFELQSASADLQPLLRGAARSCAAFERDFLRNK